MPPTNVYGVDANKSLNSDSSEQFTDIKIQPSIIILFSAVREKCHYQSIVGARLLYVVTADQI